MVIRSLAFCSNVLKSCSKTRLLPQGESMHANLLKSGFISNMPVQNLLLDHYVKCGSYHNAQKLFDEMAMRNVISWNIIISSHTHKSKKGENEKKHALQFLREMQLENVVPDHVTIVGLLGACMDLDSVMPGKQVHCFALKFGYSSDGFVGATLVNLYAKNGTVKDAHEAFDEVQTRDDVVLWNVMMSCYASNGLGEEAFSIYKSMLTEGVICDDFTYCTLVSASSCMGSKFLGMQVHSIAVKVSLDHDIFTRSALIDMYAKAGNIEEARELFDSMDSCNTVSWNSLIVEYVRFGDSEEPMKLFREMLRQGFKPDEVTVASSLSSCATLAVGNEAVQLHAYSMRYSLEAFQSVGNALVNAYAKCASIDDALKAFGFVIKPDVVTWTSLISGYAIHGLAKEALKVFERMLDEGEQPDQVAFLAVLSSCTQAGLVDVGIDHFIQMTETYKIMPTAGHYACLVDLLGRAGHITDAFALVSSFASKIYPCMFGAFLGACKIHQNVELGEWAAEILFGLEPSQLANYKLASNMYAAEKSWVDVSRVRKAMRERCREGAPTFPGCSWIELAGTVHIFLSGDRSHSDASSVYHMLDMLTYFSKVEDLTTIVDHIDDWKHGRPTYKGLENPFQWICPSALMYIC